MTGNAYAEKRMFSNSIWDHNLIMHEIMKEDNYQTINMEFCTDTRAFMQADRSCSEGSLVDCVTVRDGRVDVLETGGGVKNTVTIDTDRHGGSAGMQKRLFKVLSPSG